MELQIYVMTVVTYAGEKFSKPRLSTSMLDLRFYISSALCSRLFIFSQDWRIYENTPTCRKIFSIKNMKYTSAKCESEQIETTDLS